MAEFLNIKKRKTKLPNGHTITLELVEHPGAVLIVPFLTTTKVILLRQFRPVINAYIFELPAGTLEKGEQPLACARREIIETIAAVKAAGGDAEYLSVDITDTVELQQKLAGPVFRGR